MSHCLRMPGPHAELRTPGAMWPHSTSTQGTGGTFDGGHTAWSTCITGLTSTRSCEGVKQLPAGPHPGSPPPALFRLHPACHHHHDQPCGCCPPPTTLHVNRGYTDMLLPAVIVLRCTHGMHNQHLSLQPHTWQLHQQESLLLKVLHHAPILAEHGKSVCRSSRRQDGQ
jgi:hypothetical protein